MCESEYQGGVLSCMQLCGVQFKSYKITVVCSLSIHFIFKYLNAFGCFPINNSHHFELKKALQDFSQSQVTVRWNRK